MRFDSEKIKRVNNVSAKRTMKYYQSVLKKYSKKWFFCKLHYDFNRFLKRNF